MYGILRESLAHLSRKAITAVAVISFAILSPLVAILPTAKVSAIPNFQMPFPCGETWWASTYSGHNAIDWNDYANGSDGRTVVASMGGTATAGHTSGYGYYVFIDHGGGWQTRYAHLKEPGFSGSVTQGQVIGKVGTTGNSTGPHLHWEQRYNNVQQGTLYANGVALQPGTAENSSDPQYVSNNCAGGSVATATSSQVTPDGVQHVFVGNSNGKIHDISWGNGSQLTQWQVADLGGQINAISSQVVNGIVHVYAAVGSSIKVVSWGNGSPLTVWTVADLGSDVNTLSSQVVDGVQHVYAGSGTSVVDISWGNGSPLSVWTPALLSSTVNSLSSQLVNGVQHVYASAGSTVYSISWGNGSPLTTWGVATLSSNIVGITAPQHNNGVYQINASTETTIVNIYWGGGLPVSQWSIANLSGQTVKSISHQLVNGVQHVFAGTSAGAVYDIYWGNGEPLTQWQVGSGLGSPVVDMTSQVLNGVVQVNPITSSKAWNISWGNGSPLTQWAISTTL